MLNAFPYDDLLDRRRAADSFRQFWVTEARTRAPEVQAMERLVGARKRQLTSTTRSFWLPQISLEGALSQRMFEDGSGTTGLTLPLSGGGSGPSTFDAPTPPDQQWSLSLTASLPLFSGMERAARRQQATDQLAASRTRRMAAELGVEQAVRTALVDLETSHQAVERALEAADAAQRTLDVTQAAYREGTASLIDLIDAQTTALTTRQEASDAAYELMRDWVAVQRAGGSFRVLRTPEQQDAFQRRLNEVLDSTATRSSPTN
jgi:outer membrane protein TolC